jgi:hypothetical protein
VLQLLCGVHQCAVLGPILFLLCIMDVATLVSDLEFEYHGYADDIQVYRHYLADQQSIALTALQFQDCTVQILNWMKINRLQLNPGKTECLWIRSRSHDHLMSPCLRVGQTY